VISADRDSGGLLVDDVLAFGHRGDEGLGGDVVHGPGQAAGGVVDEGRGVVAEQGVGPSCEFQVVADVVRCLRGCHGGHRVPQPDPLVQCCQHAQPTLARQLRMGTFAALDQRIATRYAIKPMDIAESAAYLRHHMTLAGREEPLFADDAVARLHRVSSGLPRALNNAATAALIAAAAAGQDLVDDACAKKAVAELTRD